MNQLGLSGGAMIDHNQPLSRTQADDRAEPAKSWVAPLQCFVMVDIMKATLGGGQAGNDPSSSSAFSHS